MCITVFICLCFFYFLGINKIHTLKKLPFFGTVNNVFKLFRLYFAANFIDNEIKIERPGFFNNLMNVNFEKRSTTREHKIEGLWVFWSIKANEDMKRSPNRGKRDN